GSGRPARISFRHFFHGDKHVVMGMASRLAHCGHTGHSLTNPPEIGSLARKIHPRFVAFRRDDRLTHSTLAICDRAHFIVGRAYVTLGSEIAWCLTERSFDDPFFGQQGTFDYDLSIRGDEQVVTPDLGWCEPQRFSQVTANDVVLVHLERSGVTRAHVEGRVVTKNRRHRTFKIMLLVVAVDLP